MKRAIILAVLMLCPFCTNAIGQNVELFGWGTYVSTTVDQLGVYSTWDDARDASAYRAEFFIKDVGIAGLPLPPIWRKVKTAEAQWYFSGWGGTIDVTDNADGTRDLKTWNQFVSCEDIVGDCEHDWLGIYDVRVEWSTKSLFGGWRKDANATAEFTIIVPRAGGGSGGGGGIGDD